MNYETIKPYIEKKLISEGIHPENPDIRIFNYTQHCQFQAAWDEVTKQCRGLILNVVTGEVIARPFPKFFNYGEYVAKGWEIPNEVPIVSEKLDGSLGILYALNGKPWIATRGSFMSDQAQWATKWWREHVGAMPEEGKTSLFEIIYPENRIVVNYDFSGLVHLCTLSNETGEVSSGYFPDGVRNVKFIDTTDLNTLSKMDGLESEGFVIHYPDANVRMKIKFPEYVRLHKIVTGVSEIGIWEILRDGKNLDELVDKVPDEFYQWVRSVIKDLVKKFENIKTLSSDVFQLARHYPTRREQAEYIMKTSYPSVVFAMLDKKPYAPIIWKMLRPHGQKNYKVDIDQ